MANKVNTYAQGSTDLSNLGLTLDYQRTGIDQTELTSLLQIKAGSSIEVAGSLYVVQSVDEAITDAHTGKVRTVWAVPTTSGLRFETDLSSNEALFDAAKGGWYHPSNPTWRATRWEITALNKPLCIPRILPFTWGQEALIDIRPDRWVIGGKPQEGDTCELVIPQSGWYLIEMKGGTGGGGAGGTAGAAATNLGGNGGNSGTDGGTRVIMLYYRKGYKVTFILGGGGEGGTVNTTAGGKGGNGSNGTPTKWDSLASDSRTASTNSTYQSKWDTQHQSSFVVGPAAVNQYGAQGASSGFEYGQGGIGGTPTVVPTIGARGNDGSLKVLWMGVAEPIWTVVSKKV